MELAEQFERLCLREKEWLNAVFIKDEGVNTVWMDFPTTEFIATRWELDLLRRPTPDRENRRHMKLPATKLPAATAGIFILPG